MRLIWWYNITWKLWLLWYEAGLFLIRNIPNYNCFKFDYPVNQQKKFHSYVAVSDIISHNATAMYVILRNIIQANMGYVNLLLG